MAKKPGAGDSRHLAGGDPPGIDFLLWHGCRPHPEALLHLQDWAAQMGVESCITLVEVQTGDEAERLRFPGLPTFRVDGRLPPMPSGEMIRTALSEHGVAGRL